MTALSILLFELTFSVVSAILIYLVWAEADEVYPHSKASGEK